MTPIQTLPADAASEWLIPQPGPHDWLFGLFFRRNPTAAGFADLFSALVPLLQSYQPHLARHRRPLVCWASAAGGVGSTLAFSLKNATLLRPILDWAASVPDFMEAGEIPLDAGNGTGLFPWSLWTATAAVGIPSPYWEVPEALPRDPYHWSHPEPSSASDALTPGVTRFVAVTAQLIQAGVPLTDETYRAAYHFLVQQWYLPPQLRRWRNTPHLLQQAAALAATYPLAPEARAALRQSLQDRYVTARQIAAQWPISAAWVRRHLWPVIPTQAIRNRQGPQPVRLARLTDVHAWRAREHPDWPLLV